MLSLDNLFTLAMLTLLQGVLGFDNLLYISIESKRVAPDRQAFVRRVGIGLAVGLRILLLLVVMKAIEMFQAPFLSIHWNEYVAADFNVHAFVVLLGGGFIIYTAVKEIHHMLMVDQVEHSAGPRRGVGAMRQRQAELKVELPA